LARKFAKIAFANLDEGVWYASTYIVEEEFFNLEKFSLFNDFFAITCSFVKEKNH
jgi:hypothetical protein